MLCTPAFVSRPAVALSAILLASRVVSAQPQPPAQPFEPTVGQAGKDVMWVPTPESLVDKMLDLAGVTSADVVMDLGSGDGRNVIAAARRGARAIGVEYSPEMVELSRQNAERAGVSAKATFIQGDMFEADISEAHVLALFLLPQNLQRLTPKFLELRPGTRIVDNTFAIPDWTPDDSVQLGLEECWSWCKALLWIVPARVGGTWRLGRDRLRLDQSFQVVTGTLTRGGKSIAIKDGRLRGTEFTFAAAGTEYKGRVSGDTIEGSVGAADGDRRWTATRMK